MGCSVYHPSYVSENFYYHQGCLPSWFFRRLVHWLFCGRESQTCVCRLVITWCELLSRAYVLGEWYLHLCGFLYHSPRTQTWESNSHHITITLHSHMFDSVSHRITNALAYAKTRKVDTPSSNRSFLRRKKDDILISPQRPPTSGANRDTTLIQAIPLSPQDHSSN